MVTVISRTLKSSLSGTSKVWDRDSRAIKVLYTELYLYINKRHKTITKYRMVSKKNYKKKLKITGRYHQVECH
jgi:hypothetical protein